jgi:hypothetical protein
MIQNGVYKLLKAAEVGKDMPLPAGQEIEILNGVIYVNGFMVDTRLQSVFYSFIVNNQNLFQDVTRKW